MTDLIIGVVVGLFIGIYVSSPKARKWVADKAFKKKAKKQEEPKVEKKDNWDWK